MCTSKALKSYRKKNKWHVKSDLLEQHPTFQWSLKKPEVTEEMLSILSVNTDANQNYYTQ